MGVRGGGGGGTWVIFAGYVEPLPHFSINLLEFHHECCSLIGYATHLDQVEYISLFCMIVFKK